MKIKNLCRTCVHYISMRENKFTCGYDSTTYELHPDLIDKKSNKPNCTCFNGGFQDVHVGKYNTRS